MRDQIRQSISRAFGLPVTEIPEDVTSDQIEGWDSLGHLQLMLELELDFGVALETAAIPQLLSVEAIEEYLVEQGVAPAA